MLIFCLLPFSSPQTHLWCLPESCSPRVGFLILIFASGSPPQKGRFEAAEGPWICKVNIMALARTNWRWTFCTEIAWRCLQMSWFICGRVPRVNWHETSCSSTISHVVVAIGGTLVRLRGRVMAGRVREEVDGLGGWIGCYWSNRCVFWSFLLSWLTEIVMFGFVRWYSHIVTSSEPPNTKWN